MGYIRVCDLCGRPLQEAGQEYKVKKRWYSWPDDSGWKEIEVHDKCIRKLLDSLYDKQDQSK